jgi:GTP-binding protein HflX
MVARARRLVPDAIFVSALRRDGLDVLEARCLELIAEAHSSTELLVPHERYDVIARLHQVGHIQSEEQRDDGVLLVGRFPPTQAAFFAPFVVTR